MRRREFIKIMAGSAAVVPFGARAQLAHSVIGVLASGSRGSVGDNIAAFLAGLNEAGMVEGRDVAVEYRWAEGHFDRLPALAAELVRWPVNVIFAAQGNVSTLTAKLATSAIPIVFITADDPVATGLVASINRPGGNLTGVSRLGTLMLGKNLEAVHELVPAAATIGILVNPKRPTVDAEVKSVQEAAKGLGKTIRVLRASDEHDIEAAFKTISAERIGAAIVAFDAAFNSRRAQIVGLAARHAVPTSYFTHEFVRDGGLMSYGSDQAEAFKLAGNLVARILKGTKPADLPVQQVTKVELTINLKTAKTLGINVPLTLLGRADEVIE